MHDRNIDFVGAYSNGYYKKKNVEYEAFQKSNLHMNNQQYLSKY